MLLFLSFINTSFYKAVASAEWTTSIFRLIEAVSTSFTLVFAVDKVFQFHGVLDTFFIILFSDEIPNTIYNVIT